MYSRQQAGKILDSEFGRAQKIAFSASLQEQTMIVKVRSTDRRMTNKMPSVIGKRMKS